MLLNVDDVCFDLQRNIFRTLFISEREEEIDLEESLSEPFRSSLLEFVVFFFSDFFFLLRTNILLFVLLPRSSGYR